MPRKRQNRLKYEQKLFIVRLLAQYETPTETARAFKERFGFDVTVQNVENYDPNKRNGAQLSERLKTEFAAVRTKYREDLSDIPVSSQAVRVRDLHAMAKTAKRINNLKLASEIYEQIAKELGGMFTNRRLHEHTGKDGKPMHSVVDYRDVGDMTDDEIEAEIGRLEDDTGGETPSAVH